MKSLERTGSSSTRNRLHHWGFYLDKFMLSHKILYFLNDLRSLDKHLSDAVIDHEIEVTLTISDFHIPQSVPLFRQGSEAFAQYSYLLGQQCKFARMGAEYSSLCADKITYVHFLKKVIVLFSNHISFHVYLELAAPIFDVHKGCSTKRSHGHNATGTDKNPFLLCQGLIALILVTVSNICQAILNHKVIRIQLNASLS